MLRENICCAPLLFELLHLVANTKKAGKERERERERERKHLFFNSIHSHSVYNESSRLGSQFTGQLSQKILSKM
jgi:hypothetical protein